ncbi:MAG: NAD-dependent DNA ligase LigA [Bacteroidetes bacterium]|nr:NAD-dependent DNA ligase LigA [Bacteroidota bacterium]
MDKKQINERINKLRQEINFHNYQYYTLDNPLISDYEFDMLLKELEKLEIENPEFADPNSPTQKVGGEITKNFETSKHKFPMMSLGNTYSREELSDFDIRIKKSIGENFKYTCELKFDGAAIGITYTNGKFSKAVTRGDGIQGDVVTANVKTIKSLPLIIEDENIPKEFELRGEIILSHKSFNKINKERAENGEALFANPRNAASGSLKLQNSSLAAKRNLDCYIYALHSEELKFQGHYESLMQAKKWRFKVSEYTKLCNNIDEVFEYIEYWNKKRSELPFDIDGIVIKVDEYEHQETLGFTAKFPRWAISYKFQAERGKTILEDVLFQVGRTGAITPVAVLSPVQIAGTIVRRASLYNSDKINELDLHFGDYVFVEKGGEIIPKIVDVDISSRHPAAYKIIYIDHCPECNTELIRNEGEAIHYCPNSKTCPPQVQGRIEHFISRRAMNIETLGEGRIEVIINNNLVKDIADLYDLKYEQMLGLEKTVIDEETGKSKSISFREKTVSNILTAIESSKSIPYERVLFALGIRHLGETVAKKLSKHFKSINDLRNASFEELVSIHEIGERIAQSIIDYFKNEDNQNLIKRLEQSGIQLEAKEESAEVKGNALNDLSFVVSGVFSKYSRDEIKQIIENNGGKNVSSMSAKTSYLVAGENMGPQKRQKAEELGIPIISEEDLDNMINGNPS